MTLPAQNNQARCRIVGPGTDIEAYRFAFTLPRGMNPGTGTFECDIKNFLQPGREDFVLPAQPSDADLLNVEQPPPDHVAARPETLNRRRVTAEIAAGGGSVSIGPLFVTHIAPAEVSRPQDRTVGRVSVSDRRIFWPRFGGVTLRANITVPTTADEFELDPTTLNGDDAWTVAELISLLLTALGEDDGSWALHATAGKPARFSRGGTAVFDPAILSEDFPPPGNIVWTGQESAFARLGEILEKYRLDIVLPPNGPVKVVRKRSGSLPAISHDFVVENQVEYQNERIGRPHVYCVVGEPIAIVERYDNLVPVLYNASRAVIPLTAASDLQTEFGATLGQIKKGAYEGSATFFGGEWGFVTDSTGKTALAGGSLVEIENRKALLARAYRLWQIPDIADGEANAFDMPIFETAELASAGDFDLARPQPPLLWGARPVKKSLFGGDGAFDSTGTGAAFIGGRVTVEDARLGIIATTEIIGDATLPTGVAIDSSVVMNVTDAASGVSARVAHPKRGGLRQFSSLDLLTQKAPEIELGGALGMREGDPMLDLTFVAETDRDAALFYPEEPKKIKYIRVPGLQLIVALNDDGDAVSTSNKLAVQAVADKILQEAISRDESYQSVRRVYGIIVDTEPNGLVDTVSWTLDEPGGNGGTTEISAGDITQAVRSARPIATNMIDGAMPGGVPRAQYEALLARVNKLEHGDGF